MGALSILPAGARPPRRRGHGDSDRLFVEFFRAERRLFHRADGAAAVAADYDSVGRQAQDRAGLAGQLTEMSTRAPAGNGDGVWNAIA
jgi:hypothetical protein